MTDGSPVAVDEAAVPVSRGAWAKQAAAPHTRKRTVPEVRAMEARVDALEAKVQELESLVQALTRGRRKVA